MSGGIALPQQGRIASIDQFRGFAIVLMVIANFLAGVAMVPPALKHAPDVGLTVIDLVAPLFIFAIGLTYRLSLESRLARGGPFKAYMHFIVRFLAVAGIGAVFAAGESMMGEKAVTWGVLQAIGAAGLISLPLVRRPLFVRLAVGLGLLIVYQVLLDLFLLQNVLGAVHGGLFGSLSWGAMLILSTVAAELYHRQGRALYIVAIVAVVVLTVACAFFVPVSKNRVSATYVLVCTAVSMLVFLFFDCLCRVTRKGIPYFAWWGGNAILLYVFHLFLLGIFALSDVPWLYAGAPLWLWLLELAAVLAALSVVSWLLWRKKVFIRL
jgi:predicted acyltransferase